MIANPVFGQVNKHEEQLKKSMLGRKRSAPEGMPKELQKSILEQGGPELNQYLGNLYEAKQLQMLQQHKSQNPFEDQDPFTKFNSQFSTNTSTPPPQS